MKTFITIVFLSLALLLSACNSSDSDDKRRNKSTPSQGVVIESPTSTTTDTTSTENPTEPEAPTEPENTIESTIPTEPEIPASTQAELAEKLPYLQKIKNENQPIYKGPGYNYMQNGTVQKSGTYTIIEEQIDSEGNLWGKLKSGTGWVDLSQIKSGPLLTVSEAKKSLINSGKFHHWIADDSEYMMQIALYAGQTFTDVTLYNIYINEDFDELEQVCYMETWDKGLPIIADVAFPMDFSAYAIRLTDKNGIDHWFCIYESLDDGEICLDSYTPTS